jgi:hypothetical protein
MASHLSSNPSEFSASQLTDYLLSLELLLLDPARRANPESIADIFAEDFREFGKSGRSYDKASILDALASENHHPDRRVIIENFRVVALGSAALATYISIVHQSEFPEQSALRSSVWVYQDFKWQILFHQGTSITSAGPPERR